MQVSRYRSDPQISMGKQLSSASATRVIRERMGRGIRVIQTLILTGDDRLDTLAGSIYGNSKYWWVLAAASEIGWGMQVPPGTIIKVVDLNSVFEYL